MLWDLSRKIYVVDSTFVKEKQRQLKKIYVVNKKIKNILLKLNENMNIMEKMINIAYRT